MIYIFKLKLYLILLFPILGLAQNQIGNNIEIESNAVILNSAISLDGNRIGLLIGVNQPHLYMNVYELTNNEWIQLGDAINLGNEPYNYTDNISFSGDGNRISLLLDIGSNNIVYIFEYDNEFSVWNNISFFINDADIYKVKLSENGKMVGVLAKIENDSSEYYSYTTYQHLSTEWVQYGAAIIDSVNGFKTFAANQYLDKVVISDTYSNSNNQDMFNSRLNVYQRVNDTWIEYGNELLESGIGASTGMGNSLAISNDGSKIMSGDLFNEIINTYGYADNLWNYLTEVQNPSHNYFIYRIFASPDGNHLMTNDGIYQWNDKNWQLIYNDLNYDFLFSFNHSDADLIVVNNKLRSVFDNFYVFSPEVYEYAQVLEFESTTNTSEWLQNENELTFYPNPSIDGVFWCDSLIEEFVVYNGIGNIILRGNFESNINLSGCQSGIYYVRLVINNDIFFKRLVRL